MLGFCPDYVSENAEVLGSLLFRQESSTAPAKRIVRGLNAGFGQGIEQGGFADVGQADDAALESHI